MSERTHIAWTDHTFNIAWGCAKVSPGCRFCYADTLSSRYGFDVWGMTKPRRLFGDKHWAEPLKWNAQAQRDGRRHRVFCSSMADVFEEHPDLEEPRRRLWHLVHDTPWLDWQLLTKRPENIAVMVPWTSVWPVNVWIGTSVENQRWADERIPLLLETEAAVRFISAEPLLGHLHLSYWLESGGLHWVIVGGESGPQRRPMDSRWVDNIYEECSHANVPLFVKQDSGPKPGQQGLLPDYLWALKEFPA